MFKLTATLVGTSLLSAAALAGDGAAVFDAPEQLAAGGNKFEQLLFPTPVLYDIDGDEQRELVIGDLVGNVWSCEPQASDGGWARADKVKADGKPLKLNNW